jgi:uncharacterized membrane protein
MASLARVDVDAGIALMVAIGEALENSVYLLCLLGQLNLHKQLPHSHIDRISKEGKLAHVTT